MSEILSTFFQSEIEVSVYPFTYSPFVLLL